MNESAFNPGQPQSVANKVVVGLERISEAFKALLWEKAKTIGLSPIQIQLLLFVAYHKPELCNVSHLAREFNITKPTVSDAVKALEQKKMIIKDYSSADNRSYTILLSTLGKQVVDQTSDFANPVKSAIDNLEGEDLDNVFSTISKLIYQLHQKNILTVQRTCYGCTYYRNDNSGHYCNLLEKALPNQEIRLDCPEYEAKNGN